MRWCKFIIPLTFLLTACAGNGPQDKSQGLERFAKSDIDDVIEIHQQAMMADLQKLMIKLYKRNPGQRHDRDSRSIKESVALVFARPASFRYPQWQSIQKPTDIIRLSLDERYKEDRVLAFIIGLRRMIMASYDENTEFFYLTTINQQKLYNSARNIEIAAWLLANKKDKHEHLLLLSDSLVGEKRNLSYQRLFGKMIATQDNLAKVISQKTGRIIRTVIVRAASLMFLPV